MALVSDTVKNGSWLQHEGEKSAFGASRSVTEQVELCGHVAVPRQLPLTHAGFTLSLLGQRSLARQTKPSLFAPGASASLRTGSGWKTVDGRPRASSLPPS
ncbi:unnamed protein product [Pleuronectes platessa]|uniref:Uncharacterized protein n=1 Tax=Pleuronectes platessa TaxID=8262 RepID=A0A9N7VWS0_PLEPL|nr:unnamed protein product [Pleuronectes platessa]